MQSLFIDLKNYELVNKLKIRKLQRSQNMCHSLTRNGKNSITVVKLLRKFVKKIFSNLVND